MCHISMSVPGSQSLQIFAHGCVAQVGSAAGRFWNVPMPRTHSPSRRAPLQAMRSGVWPSFWNSHFNKCECFFSIGCSSISIEFFSRTTHFANLFNLCNTGTFFRMWPLWNALWNSWATEPRSCRHRSCPPRFVLRCQKRTADQHTDSQEQVLGGVYQQFSGISLNHFVTRCLVMLYNVEISEVWSVKPNAFGLPQLVITGDHDVFGTCTPACVGPKSLGKSDLSWLDDDRRQMCQEFLA